MPLTIGGSCPQCGAIFGLDEADQNRCFSCGYPDVKEEEEENDEDSN